MVGDTAHREKGDNVTLRQVQRRMEQAIIHLEKVLAQGGEHLSDREREQVRKASSALMTIEFRVYSDTL